NACIRRDRRHVQGPVERSSQEALGHKGVAAGRILQRSHRHHCQAADRADHGDQAREDRAEHRQAHRLRVASPVCRCERAMGLASLQRRCARHYRAKLLPQRPRTRVRELARVLGFLRARRLLRDWTMSHCNDIAWIKARIAKTEELIEKYEDAILALSSGAVQTYHLDTGQTRQSVTKMHLSQLQGALAKLESRREAYLSQLGC